MTDDAPGRLYYCTRCGDHYSDSVRCPDCGNRGELA